ncbi:MAG: hypothetical protein JXL97_03575 [Bacteroidales bacterium]|nr:hypothetical protein [Bacteroidales bacterium]
MKTLFISIFLLFSISVFSQVVDNNCMYKGVKLYGEVEVVSSFADFQVYVCQNYCSQCYEVEIVDAYPSCNQWQIVNSYANFTIEITKYSSFADFCIYIKDNKYKDAFIRQYVKSK